MEPRSLTPSLLLTLFLPHLLSAAVSSSSSSSAPLSSSSSPSPSPAASLPPPRPRLGTPPKQLEYDQPPFLLPRNTAPPRPRFSCSPGHRDCRQPQQSVTRKSPSKPELNFGEKLGLLFVGVAAALQVLFGTLLVYKRIQLKKVQRREQRDMASSSGLST